MEVARRVIGQPGGRGAPPRQRGPRRRLSAARRLRPRGGEVLGAVPQPQEPPPEAGRGLLRNGDLRAGPSARGLPGGDPRIGLRRRLRAQPPVAAIRPRAPPTVEVTRLLREAAKTVEITLLDHVIIGRPGADPLGRGYYSFREAGMI